MLITKAESAWMYAKDAVLAHEGGFVDHASDPGGATKCGVSLRFLRSLGLSIGDRDGDGDIDVDDIKALTPEDAADIFRRKFWTEAGCGDVAEVSPAIAVKLFDMAVNMGSRQAVKLLQRSISAFYDTSLGDMVADDGIVGPITLGMIPNVPSGALLCELCAQQRKFYLGLIESKPDLAVFSAGWLRRAAWVPSVRGA
ncbi:MAG: hypothetical protein K9H25_23065 [Rhodospirillum sp.]|nr:hypothetical protein [Rhodospirillum sp.]MCF8491375.1 hypothetical protein [Rhodospirillum sp.]MCF8500199.1 hypothetical protein [Rhodospirillum sp.]